MLGDVWLRDAPDENARLYEVILAYTPVKVLAVYDTWVKIGWMNEETYQEAWVPLRWVALVAPIPIDLTTPTPTPLSQNLRELLLVFVS